VDRPILPRPVSSERETGRMNFHVFVSSCGFPAVITPFRGGDSPPLVHHPGPSLGPTRLQIRENRMHQQCLIRARPRLMPGAPLCALAILLAVAVPSAIGAQEAGEGEQDPFLVPGFVVTPTRTPVAASRTPTPVTILTGSELRSRGVRSVADALREVPGMRVVQAGGSGGQTSLFLRGGQSNYVRVLVDGVPVNEAGGAMDLADLSTDQVERIEVVRGPASVLYGSDAIAGVVQIFTTRGRGAPTLEASALGGIGERRYGSGRYGLSEVDATLSGAGRSLSWAMGGSRSATQGDYPLNNQRTLNALNTRVQWSDASKRTDVTLSSRLSDSSTGLPTDGAGALVDENANLERRFWSSTLEFGRRLGERVEGRVQLGYTSRGQVSVDEPDSPTDTLGIFRTLLDSKSARRSADVRVNARMGGSTVTLGGTFEALEGSTRYESESEWGPFDAAASFNRSNSAAYIQLLSEPLHGLHMTLGGRVDRNETFGSFETFRAGFSWNGWEGGRIRGAAGRAFREPTFAENFGSGFGDTGNAELVPERTRSMEVGLDHALGPVILGVTGFQQRFLDMIQYTSSISEPSAPNYYNVGAAEANGLEWTAEITLGWIMLTGHYTWLLTRVLDPGLATDATFVEGERMIRRPPHAGSLMARMPITGGTVTGTLHVVGKRDDLDFASWPAARVTLPRHTTLDISLERTIPVIPVEGTRFLLRVDNVLDASYEGIAGFPAPGRIVRLGVRVSPRL